MKFSDSNVSTAFSAMSFDGKHFFLIATPVFLLLAAGLYALSWNAVTAGFLSDDAVYLLMADCFGSLAKENPELASYAMRQSLFPPLYPLLLAAFGAGSSDLLRAHLVTTTTFVVALAIFGVWIWSQTRDRVGSMLLVLAFALLPGVLIQNLETLSEFPYLMFSLGAIWLADRPPSVRWGYLPVALCVSLAALTRSAGFSLILALAIWLLRQRREERLPCFALAMIPSLLWILVKRWDFGSQAGYSSNWSLLFYASSASLPSFLMQQCRSLWHALLADMDFWQSGLTLFAAALTLLIALWTWGRRLREWRLDAWYLLIGGAMLMVYPFPDFFSRLILPWVPIVIFYCYQGLRAVGAKVGGRTSGKLAAYSYVAIVFLAIAPSAGFITSRLAEPIADDMAHWKHTRYWLRPAPGDLAFAKADVAFRQNLIESIRQAGQMVHQGDCILGVHAAIGMLYARRVFVQPPPPSADPVEFEQRMLGCPYALLMPVGGRIGNDRVAAFYPHDRLPDSAQTMHVWADPADPHNPTGILVRLKASPQRPDQARAAASVH